MAKTPKDADEFTPEEIARRADAALKRALMTPPKPYTPGAKAPKRKQRPASKGRVFKGRTRG
jgi:hypothetical protein